MTAVELSLRVGDRIQEGDRFGTFLGRDYESSDGYTTYYQVFWDWDSGPTRYSSDQELQWTALTRPVPTLASLKLVVGDCIEWSQKNWLVTAVGEQEVSVMNRSGWKTDLSLCLPAKDFKKLEVPK